MKKNIFKKLFIKISRILGYEIIDQTEFISPTLDKKLNDDLSTINNKSIVLPLGEVKITRKIKSVLIILRINTEIEIWDQNKKRLFELPKIEYTLRSLNSLIKSINFRLYLGLNELSDLFSNNSFLILFWVHFLAINLFCGSWIVNDYQKFGVSKILMFLPLVITYLIGPLGIFVYWIIRIFYAKKINLYD